MAAQLVDDDIAPVPCEEISGILKGGFERLRTVSGSGSNFGLAIFDAEAGPFLPLVLVLG